jgi:thioredoxin 1
MKPRTISDGEFEREVLNADGLIIVNFLAAWSRSCRSILRVLDVLGERYNSELKILTLNVDKHPELVKEFSIQKIPTIFFFEGGKVVDKAEGISSANNLEARIQRLLPIPECDTDSETGHCGCGSRKVVDMSLTIH